MVHTVPCNCLGGPQFFQVFQSTESAIFGLPAAEKLMPHFFFSNANVVGTDKVTPVANRAELA